MLHALLLLQLVVTPPRAHEAEELVHASMDDYDLGYFEQALGEAEKAYRLDPLPQILFNVGQCHRALKHWEKAAFFFQRYLAKLPHAPNRQLVEGLLAEVQRDLAAEQLRSRTTASAPGAVVVVSPLSVPPRAAGAAPPGVPAAAVELSVEKTAESPHSHTAAYLLGSVAVASLVVMVVGIVQVENFQSIVGRLNNPTSYTAWQKDDSTATGELSGAQVWEVVAFATGAMALGTGTAAAFTW